MDVVPLPDTFVVPPWMLPRDTTAYIWAAFHNEFMDSLSRHRVLGIDAKFETTGFKWRLPLLLLTITTTRFPQGQYCSGMDTRCHVSLFYISL